MASICSIGRIEAGTSTRCRASTNCPIRPGQYVPAATVGPLLTWQYYDLRSRPPRKGNNLIEVRLLERNAAFEKPWARCPLVLSDVELEVKYRWPWADWKRPSHG